MFTTDVAREMFSVFQPFDGTTHKVAARDYLTALYAVWDTLYGDEGCKASKTRSRDKLREYCTFTSTTDKTHEIIVRYR